MKETERHHNAVVAFSMQVVDYRPTSKTRSDSIQSIEQLSYSKRKRMVKESRPNLRNPKYGTITQGTVFSCAQVSRYTDCEVFGLTITARCDMAQQKYPVLNYLPIVKLSDWLRRDGLDILFENEKNSQLGKLNSMLRNANVAETLPRSVPLQQIAEVNFPLNIGSNNKKKDAQKFHDLVKLILDFESLSINSMTDMFDWFQENRKKEVCDLIRRLSKHSVLGHYFFEKITFEETNPKGYVCLLREVNTLPKNVAEQLGEGLDRAHYERLRDEYCYNVASLRIPQDDLAMPVTEIDSPTIEHLLQAFSNLFGRIGVADPDYKLIDFIAEQCLKNTTESMR